MKTFLRLTNGGLVNLDHVVSLAVPARGGTPGTNSAHVVVGLVNQGTAFVKATNLGKLEEALQDQVRIVE